MAIYVRRGMEKDFDPEKMKAGEWAVSVDPDRKKQKIWMCFAPGVVKRLGTYEDFMDQIAEINADMMEQYIKQFNDILKQVENDKDIVASDYEFIAEFKKILEETYMPNINTASSNATSAAQTAQTAQEGATESATQAAESARQAEIAKDSAQKYSANALKNAQNAQTAENKAASAASDAVSNAMLATTSRDTAKMHEDNARKYMEGARDAAEEVTQEMQDTVSNNTLHIEKLEERIEEAEDWCQNLEDVGSNNALGIKQLKEKAESISTEAKMAIEELADKKITKFYASNLGENHLEDSDNGKIQDMFIYGRSEQKQYKGYNLLKDENVIVFNDGNYICSNQKYLNEGTIEIVTGETYTFSLGVVSTDGQIKLFDDSNNLIKSIYISNKRIFTFIVPENVVSMSYYAKITTDSTASLEKAKAMLIVGSEELAYEPYVGGIPSPNPGYPQEIRNVLNPSVMICGKNLIQCEDGKEYKLSDTTSNFIGVLVNYSGKINTQKGKKYTISFEYETSNPGIFRLNAFQKVITGNLLAKDNNIKSGKNKIAVTFVAEGIIKKGWLYIQFRRTIQDELFEITIRNIQIEEGEECTEYEPYKEQEVSFPYTLNAIPVSSGGNITIDGQQYISDYIDVENKKLIKMTDSIILKGTENWQKSASTDCDKFTLVTKDTTAMKSFGYCTHFGVVNVYTNTMGKICRNEYSGIVQIVINFGVYGKITLEDFKNWLSNNNITLTYVRNDKSEINLTDKEFNSFKNLQTYYPITNICISSEQLDGYTKFNYPLSMKNGWDYIKQQIGDTRDYIYDMDLATAEAYVNSEYAVALTELEVM